MLSVCVVIFVVISSSNMDILPSGNIFRELQDIHDTGYFSAQPTLEENWQQVSYFENLAFIDSVNKPKHLNKCVFLLLSLL